MRLSNTTYDRLKWFALVFIPAFEVLILTLGKIWGFPYYAEIGATVAAVGVFIAAIIGVSSKEYRKQAALLDYEATEPDDSYTETYLTVDELAELRNRLQFEYEHKDDAEEGDVNV